jgi:hypothetical protein
MFLRIFLCLLTTKINQDSDITNTAMITMTGIASMGSIPFEFLLLKAY